MAKISAKWLDLDPEQFEVIEGQPLKIKEEILGSGSSGDTEVESIYKNNVTVTEALTLDAGGMNNCYNCDAQSANVNGAGAGGIFAHQASSINCHSATANNCQNGIYALRGSSINADESTATNCIDYAYISNRSSMLTAFGGDGSGSVIWSYAIYDGSTLDCSSPKNSFGSPTYTCTPNTLTASGVIYQ